MEVDLPCVFLGNMEKTEDAAARYQCWVGFHHVTGQLKNCVACQYGSFILVFHYMNELWLSEQTV